MFTHSIWSTVINKASTSFTDLLHSIYERLPQAWATNSYDEVSWMALYNVRYSGHFIA